MIRESKKQALVENYRELNDNTCSLREYVEECADQDPNFFRFLFDEDFNLDFDLPDVYIEEYQEFLESL